MRPMEVPFAVASGVRTAVGLAVVLTFNLLRTVFVGVLLLGPTVAYLLIGRLSGTERHKLIRREFLTLVMLDLALTRHFTLLLGYSLPAVTAAGWATAGSTTTLGDATFFLSWVTVTAPTEGGRWIAFLLAGYGMIGIGLLAGVVAATYSTVMESFPNSDAALRERIADDRSYDGTEDDEQVDASDIDLSDMRPDGMDYYVRSLVIDGLDRTVRQGHVATPAFEPLWRFVFLGPPER